MKQPAKKILLLIIAVYCIAAYADFKKGLMEGFFQKCDKQIKASGKNNDSDDFDSLIIPVIIKMY
jgi:hypothetical protein